MIKPKSYMSMALTGMVVLILEVSYLVLTPTPLKGVCVDRKMWWEGAPWEIGAYDYDKPVLDKETGKQRTCYGLPTPSR